MIEIGRKKVSVVRVRKGSKLVPLLDEHGEPVTKVTASNVWRVTKGTLGGQFGPDRTRNLVVGLVNGDLLVFKPKGTRQKVTVNINDVYAWCLRSKALSAQLVKARERKEALKSRREARRTKYAEERVRKPIEQ